MVLSSSQLYCVITYLKYPFLECSAEITYECKASISGGSTFEIMDKCLTQ